jgi:hypothetical protein
VGSVSTSVLSVSEPSQFEGTKLLWCRTFRCPTAWCQCFSVDGVGAVPIVADPLPLRLAA